MVNGYGHSQAAKVAWAERKVFSGEGSQLRAKGTHQKTNENGEKIISQALYNRLVRPVLKAGGLVKRGGEDVEAHLDAVGASASQIADVILFRKNPTVSDVIEETYHFNQNRRGLNADKPDSLRIILNEIDAKKHLLLVKERYKIPVEETELTKKQLETYEQMLTDWRDANESN